MQKLLHRGSFKVLTGEVWSSLVNGEYSHYVRFYYEKVNYILSLLKDTPYHSDKVEQSNDLSIYACQGRGMI